MQDQIKMHPTDLPELLASLFQRWTHKSIVTIPKYCGLCGRPSKGNWFTGYYLSCISEHLRREQVSTPQK